MSCGRVRTVDDEVMDEVMYEVELLEDSHMHYIVADGGSTKCAYSSGVLLMY